MHHYNHGNYVRRQKKKKNGWRWGVLVGTKTKWCVRDGSWMGQSDCEKVVPLQNNFWGISLTSLFCEASLTDARLKKTQWTGSPEKHRANTLKFLNCDTHPFKDTIDHYLLKDESYHDVIFQKRPLFDYFC